MILVSLRRQEYSIMATSEAEPQTEFSSCIRKGRRNACVDIKYCTCETADKGSDGAAKDDSPGESCPIHNIVDEPSATVVKDT